MAINTLQLAEDFEIIKQDGNEYLYFKQPNGEISDGQVGKGGYGVFKFTVEGWTPLTQYGTFPISEYSLEHPFEALFMAGGAGELSVRQIEENDYHRNPPLVPVCGNRVGEAGHFFGTDPKGRRRLKHSPKCWAGAKPVHFPQMDGKPVPVKNVCMFCGREDFGLPKAREQHLWVAHKDEMTKMRSSDETAKIVAAALKQMGIKPRPFACGLCSEAYETAPQLIEHMALHDLAVDETPEVIGEVASESQEPAPVSVRKGRS